MACGLGSGATLALDGFAIGPMSAYATPVDSNATDTQSRVAMRPQKRIRASCALRRLSRNLLLSNHPFG